MTKTKSKFWFTLRLLLYSFFLISVIACNNSSEPELNYGRRDYVWTIDTIDIEPLYYMRMWGSSPENMWFVADGASGTANTLWHYDGIGWKNNQYPEFFDPNHINGTSKNNIWIVTDRNRFYNYNGHDWILHTELHLDNAGHLLFNKTNGKGRNEYYAVGMAAMDKSDWWGKKHWGVIAKFNGIEWNFLQIDSIANQFYGIEYDFKHEKYFIKGFDINGHEKEYIYEMKNDSLKLLFADTRISFNDVGEEVLWLEGNNICEMSGGKLNLIYTIKAAGYQSEIFGTNRKNIFIQTKLGIVHFNGVDEELILPAEDKWFLRDVFVLPATVFFIYKNQSNMEYYIYKGELI